MGLVDRIANLTSPNAWRSPAWMVATTVTTTAPGATRPGLFPYSQGL